MNELRKFEEDNGHLFDYKLVDAGETLVTKRLIY